MPQPTIEQRAFVSNAVQQAPRYKMKIAKTAAAIITIPVAIAALQHSTG